MIAIYDTEISPHTVSIDLKIQIVKFFVSVQDFMVKPLIFFTYFKHTAISSRKKNRVTFWKFHVENMVIGANYLQLKMAKLARRWLHMKPIHCILLLGLVPIDGVRNK